MSTSQLRTAKGLIRAAGHAGDRRLRDTARDECDPSDGDKPVDPY